MHSLRVWDPRASIFFTVRRVLVVDDEENIRLVLRTLLKRHGYEVETAPGGEEALGLVESFGPDVVITQDLCHVCAVAAPPPARFSVPAFPLSPHLSNTYVCASPPRHISNVRGDLTAADHFAVQLHKRPPAARSRPAFKCLNAW